MNVNRPMISRTGMRLSNATRKVAGEGASAWKVHFRATQLAAEGRDVIFLSVGDPDFDTPGRIVDEAVRALHNGRTHYTDFAGMPELRAAIAEQRFQESGQRVSPDNVIVLSGGQACLFASMFCIAEAGDEVIVPEPMYATYPAVVRATGARMVPVALDASRNFHLDVEAVEAAVTERTRAILVNFPHNPTGAMLTREEAQGLADLCRRHDLWLLSDEVYSSLNYQGEFVSPAAMAQMEERSIIISSLSKSHAMPGWRIGWVIVPDGMGEHIRNMVQCVLFGTPPFVMDAALVAIKEEHAEVQVMLQEYARRRQAMIDAVARVPKVSIVAPEGGMFVMLDIRETGMGSEEFAGRLVESEAVSMLPGNGFGPTGEGYLRVSLTQPVERIEEAVMRLARFVSAAGN